MSSLKNKFRNFFSQKLNYPSASSDNPLLCLILLALFIYFIYVFALKAFLYIDLDFGWQVRMGQYILEHWIPATDPLTYTMSSFPYIDHEWITSILFYLSHRYLGMNGLAVMMIVIFSLAVYLPVNFRSLKLNKTSFIFFLSACAILLTFFGIRAQVVGWLLFSLLINIVWSGDLGKKNLLIPLLMLVWVNIHGSFVVGVVLLAGLALGRLFKKTLSRQILFIILLSFLATFINPYGYRVWGEVISQIFDVDSKMRIGEWMPLLYTINHTTFFYLLYIISSFLVIVIVRRLAKPVELALLFIFALGAFTSIRNIPFYVLFSLPLLLASIDQMNKQSPGKRFILVKKYSLGLVLFALVATSFVEIVSVQVNVNSVRESREYPVKAIDYLRRHLSEKQILSVWEWGGYLDWKFPEKKVFIDGRTTIWHRQSEVKNESSNIYKENEMLLTGRIHLKKIVQKYSIDTLLLPVSIRKNRILTRQLHQDGWTIKYQDSVAVVYQKR